MEFNMEALMPILTAWAIKIVLALAIFLIGKWISRRITNVIRKLMKRAELDPTLINFLANIVYAILLVAVILAALDTLDLGAVETRPYLAGQVLQGNTQRLGFRFHIQLDFGSAALIGVSDVIQAFIAVHSACQFLRSTPNLVNIGANQLDRDCRTTAWTSCTGKAQLFNPRNLTDFFTPATQNLGTGKNSFVLFNEFRDYLPPDFTLGE